MENNDDDTGYINYRIAVTDRYKDVFSHFYFAENKSGATVTKTFLPSYQTILLFSFGAAPLLYSKQNTQLEIEKCLMLGPVKQSFDYALPPNAQILAVNFKDDAFYRFFGDAILAEHVHFNPDDLVNENCFSLLWAQLTKITDITLRVNHILNFCEPYLLRRNKTAEQLANFSQQLLSPIKTVAGQNSQTERNLQRIQKKHFGYSAKEYNRYTRFFKNY